jgi:hypothetical protein
MRFSGEVIEEQVMTEEGMVTMPIVCEPVPDTSSEEVERAYLGGLPPVEFREIKDPSKEKIPTPLDERGIVDSDKLIQVVNETVRLEYKWPGKADKHHGQWQKADYVALQAWSPETHAFAFREMAPNKMLIPRIYHNRIHAVTVEPPMPPPEVMRESVKEWIIFKNFFESVQQTTQVVRIFDRERSRRTFNTQQEDILNEELLRKLSGVFLNLEALETVPIERWPFSPEMRLQIAAGQIGNLVLRGWQRRTRDVRRPDLQALSEVA